MDRSTAAIIAALAFSIAGCQTPAPLPPVTVDQSCTLFSPIMIPYGEHVSDELGRRILQYDKLLAAHCPNVAADQPRNTK